MRRLASFRSSPRLRGTGRASFVRCSSSWALDFVQPRPPFPGARVLAQFIAARVAVELVLGRIEG
jgi:hypothetical protein